MIFNYFLIGEDGIELIWFKYMNMLIIKNIKLLVAHCSETKDSQNLSDLDLHKFI